MPGTKAGAAKAVITTKERKGEMFYHLIGSLGGSKTGIKKGFGAMDPAKLSELSRKGGRISRPRTKKPL